MKWRVGFKVPRNLYRGDEPIAMLATAELAAELAERLNDVDALAVALAAQAANCGCPLWCKLCERSIRLLANLNKRSPR